MTPHEYLATLRVHVAAYDLERALTSQRVVRSYLAQRSLAPPRRILSPTLARLRMLRAQLETIDVSVPQLKRN